MATAGRTGPRAHVAAEKVWPLWAGVAKGKKKEKGPQVWATGGKWWPRTKVRQWGTAGYPLPLGTGQGAEAPSVLHRTWLGGGPAWPHSRKS
jgi:hypothetical protein